MISQCLWSFLMEHKTTQIGFVLTHRDISSNSLQERWGQGQTWQLHIKLSSYLPPSRFHTCTHWEKDFTSVTNVFVDFLDISLHRKCKKISIVIKIWLEKLSNWQRVTISYFTPFLLVTLKQRTQFFVYCYFVSCPWACFWKITQSCTKQSLVIHLNVFW